MTQFSKSQNGRQLDLSGIIPPMVTAFSPTTEELDLDLIRQETEYLISTGVGAICIAGSTGEGQGMSEEEIGLLNRTVVEQADGRVRVLAGIIADSTIEAVRKGRAAAKAGVDALQLTPPHYLWAPSIDSLVHHFDVIGDAVELPLLIYNVIPWVDIDVHAMNAIIDRSPWVLGVKQSGGDMHKVADMLAVLHEKVPITTGIDDLLYPTFVLGVDGAITCMTAVFPRETRRLYELVREQRHDEALALHQKLLPVWRSIEGPGMPANAKYALSLLGRDNGVARSPITPPDEDLKLRIRTELEKAQLV
ncbi:dihydrodipicolinate synthase family protein [Microlunatus soli]|uniref:4-hydroxy-tetrahydrodipicolinate synthase n=1 Tax=Microlunatus soli TaxID=630515 RepID=A0A1H1U2F0_9ACTN|nr:dihydrodipicolinate synthase family protein [Microlunatus soli]SDS66662.1 4-hydroxy-tetrahydrodipicolinate synthase [Microlunatus soli]